MQAVIDASSWTMPPVFRWLQSAVGAGVEPSEMARTFNIGIGMVVVCSKDKAAEVKAELEKAGETVFEIGSLQACADNATPVVLNNLGKAFGVE
jgi:phosphoribosylformylglycinamidine cyclo-ligase